jgi:hypothetical protein
MNKIVFSLLAMTLLFVSCKKEDVKPETKPVEKIKLGESVTSQYEKIILWSDAILTTGFYKLYLSVMDGNSKNIPNATVHFQPLMDMGTMKHSSPTEQPVYNSTTGLYEGAVVFTMPSGMHSWMINVTINGEMKTMNVVIPDAKTKIVGSYVGTDGNKYVVALIPPKKWEVGMNDLELLINQNQMMSFPAVDGLKISFSPEMPSMGHGSPNNVHPVNIGNGRYKGKVNYTMTGDWRFHFKISKNDVVIVEDATIDILF